MVRLRVLLAAVVLAGFAQVPAAADVPLVQRLYLLAAHTEFLYWSADASDPELQVASVQRVCPDVPWGRGAKPCSSQPAGVGSVRVHQVGFLPATRFDADVQWTPARPLRFRFALAVDSPLAYTVHLTLQNGAGVLLESPAATQVGAGVWEGELRAGSLPLGGANLFGVRVRTEAPRVSFTLQTAGKSWIDLPEAAPGRAVPRLIQESPRPDSLQEFSTPHRRLQFNDDGWHVQAFSGDLAATRHFTVDLADDAALVYAWVEVFDTPVVHDIARGRPAEPEKLYTVPVISLSRDGTEIAHGTNRARVAGHASGRGMDTLAAFDVAAGPASLEIRPVHDDQASDATYRAYVLHTTSPRTLHSIRWRFTPAEFEPVVHGRLPLVGSCPGTGEVVPASKEVTTLRADLSWDTAGAGQQWTLGYGLPGVGQYGCGEAGTGPWLRLTMGAHDRVWLLGAAPSRSSTFVSYRDTVFTIEVVFNYVPEVRTA